jgi:hypothetical protein
MATEPVRNLTDADIDALATAVAEKIKMSDDDIQRIVNNAQEVMVDGFYKGVGKNFWSAVQKGLGLILVGFAAYGLGYFKGWKP